MLSTEDVFTLGLTSMLKSVLVAPTNQFEYGLSMLSKPL
jgi:hypothetical protein